MPDTRVQDEQGNIHVFPDGSTPEMMAKALGVKPPAPPIPDANAQAKQSLQKIPQFTSPTDQLRGQVANAQESPQYQNYMRNSGSLAGNVAGSMATGGLFPIVRAAGIAKNILPFLGRTAASGAGMGAGSLVGGATPQEAKVAAETGVVGQPLAEGAGALLSKIAPSMAESALKVTERMRGRGRTIGKSVLDDTSGVRPATIAQSASSKIGDFTGKMEDAVHQTTSSGAMGTTQPAHDVLQSAIDNLPRNARTIRDKFNSLHDLLDLDGAQGPVRSQYTPDELLEMKRGIGKEMQSWPPEWQKMGDVKQVQQRLYGALDGELDRLVPGNDAVNQKISSLIPAKQQAARLSDQASTTQRIAGRVAAHTGALAGSGIGGYLGYREGGPKGAALGATAGLALPELLASPTFQMGLARTANAAGPVATSPTVLPWLKAIASQQKSKKQADAQNQ